MVTRRESALCDSVWGKIGEKWQGSGSRSALRNERNWVDPEGLRGHNSSAWPVAMFSPCGSQLGLATFLSRGGRNSRISAPRRSPMTKLDAWRTASVLFLVCAAAAIAAPAQTLTNLFTFNRTDGWDPVAPLVQGIDGNFYGVTYQGGAGANPAGTVFKVTPAGGLTTLDNFCTQSNGADGSTPASGLVLATDGNFYGTASEAGANIVGGTVYKVTATGKLTTLYSFCAQENCRSEE